ncbi:hypothetical protein Tco_0401296 [Tanacetum coccineum]
MTILTLLIKSTFIVQKGPVYILHKIPPQIIHTVVTSVVLIDDIFCQRCTEISSGSTTTRSDYSLPDYEAFYDHIEEKSSGSTTTHADFSQYDSRLDSAYLVFVVYCPGLPDFEASCVTVFVIRHSTGYSLKDKNEAKPDKTEHGFGKSAKN